MRYTNRIVRFISLTPSWLGLLLAGMLAAGCAPEPEAKKAPLLVPAIRIADTKALTERAFPGRARAGQEVNLSFRVTGPLIELPVSVGDRVKAGDVIARIDSQDYMSALGAATGQLERAQAAARRAEADYQRIENVYRKDPGATSQTARDLARSTRDSTGANVRSLSSAVKTAQDKVNYTSLRAPFSGQVVATYVSNFETVVAKQPILRLLDPASIQFLISVPESLINYAPLVEDITVTFDALPGVNVPAKVKEVGREASQATRTYPVTIVMEQPEGTEILPGMAGSAKVTSRLPDDAKQAGLQIPATAVFAGDDPAKSFVWIIDEPTKTLKSREVQTGQLTQRGVLIRSGITPGEWVVVKGVHSVAEGQTVRILDLSGEGTSS